MMFPQFASTAANFTRASSLVLKVGTDAHLYDDPHDADIVRLLDSKFDAEKIEGMKRLLALMSQGCDVSNFFPQVVKNIASPSLEVKKLVYIYLVHYAEKRPDEALLSINTFQKDLLDLNPLVRAWALRAMSGIQVHVVTPLILMAVQKCAKDTSPYVRRCAANAIPKLHALNKEQYHDALEELIGLLLDDESPGVVGAAAAAFVLVCPAQFSLVALRFPKLCESLPDVEEWGQVFLVDILLHYVVARHGLPGHGKLSQERCLLTKENTKEEDFISNSNISTKPNGVEKDRLSVPLKLKDCSAHVSEAKTDTLKSIQVQDYGSDMSENETNHFEIAGNVQLLLQCTLPLLWSRNSAVVLAAAGVHWLLAPKREKKKIVKPLVFLMRSSHDSQYVVMRNLFTFAKERPYLFQDFYEDFLIQSSDAQHIRALKLDILALIATESSISVLLQEFQAYVKDPDRRFAADTVRAIGKCASRHPSIALTCMEGLVSLAIGHQSSTRDGDIKPTKNGSTKAVSKQKVTEKQLSGNFPTHTIEEDREAVVVTQAVLAIRSIVQQHFQELEKAFALLVRDLDHIKVPAARAVVIWMIGEYSCESSLVKDMLATIFRYLGACFLKEEGETKLQILNCICKLVLHSHSSLGSSLKTALLVLTYVLDLGSCDGNYDVRDRARMLRQLMAVHLNSFSTDGIETSSLIDNVSSSPTSNLEATVSTVSSLPGQILLSTKSTSLLPSASHERIFLPGSMSHIVHHNAPGYRALPEPCSVQDPFQELTATSILEEFPSIPSRLNLSEPEIEENSEYGESYYSRSSNTDSGEGSGFKGSFKQEGNGIVHADASESESSMETTDDSAGLQEHSVKTEEERNDKPLICLSDTESEPSNKEQDSEEQQVDTEQSSSVGLQLRSSVDLESWLGSSSLETVKGMNYASLEQGTPTGFATFSLGSVSTEAKKMTLLDFTNGEGLEVKYCYCFKGPGYIQNMVCVRLFMHNRSSDTLSAISVKSWELDESACRDLRKEEETAVVISSQDISALEPHQEAEVDLHINFHQRLVPVKLAVHCNKKCFQVKLAPDIGAFIKPKVMSREEFMTAESRLLGMFESTRRCLLTRPTAGCTPGNLTPQQTDEVMISFARLVASRVMQSINVSLIPVTIPIFMGVTGGDAWSLILRFSGETLLGSMLCLITLLVESDSSTHSSSIVPVLVKVNCEDSVFGLNLLNRLDKALNEKD